MVLDSHGIWRSLQFRIYTSEQPIIKLQLENPIWGELQDLLLVILLICSLLLEKQGLSWIPSHPASLLPKRWQLQEELEESHFSPAWSLNSHGMPKYRRCCIVSKREDPCSGKFYPHTGAL